MLYSTSLVKDDNASWAANSIQSTNRDDTVNKRSCNRWFFRFRSR